MNDQVDGQVIKEYIKAGSLQAFTVIIIGQLLYIAAQTATQIWLSEWSNDSMNDTMAISQEPYRLGVYGGLVFLQGTYNIYLLKLSEIIN